MEKYFLDYYLNEQLYYNYYMKKGIDGKEYPKPFQFKGKSSMALKLGKGEKDQFRLIKALRVLVFFQRGISEVSAISISKRRGVWRVEVKLSSQEGLDFLNYYLRSFLVALSQKGLKARTFISNEGWLFLFRELGELRLRGLYYDYYNWSTMWQVTLIFPSNRVSLTDRKIFFSGLKLKYKGK